MTDAETPFKNLFGTFYPTHCVVAMVDQESDAKQALAELETAGFDQNEVTLATSAQILQNNETRRAQRNIGQRIAGGFPGEEQVVVQEYLEAAERGANAVVVRTPDPARREEARTILRKRGGHSMHYFGDHTITDIP